MTTDEPAPPPPAPRSWRRKVLRAALLYAVLPYLVVTLVFAVAQRKLLYRPAVADRLALRDAGLDERFGRDLELTTPDGETLRGWLVNATGDGAGAGGGPRPLVIYFPGNSLNRRERLADLREVASRGVDVLIFDYRGFGDSTGAPSEAALSADARLVRRFARDELGYDEHRTVLFGESLGGAVALSLWDGSNPDPPRPAGVILNSTFASMPQTVRWHYPWFPFHWLLLDRWPSVERIARVEAPITVFHGSADAMIPPAHGRALAAASPRARFIKIPGGTHNDLPPARLRRALDRFVETPPPRRAGPGAGGRERGAGTIRAPVPPLEGAP